MNPRGISSRNITHRASRLPVFLFRPSSLCTTTFASCTRPSKPSRGLRWQPLHPGHATLSPLLRILRRILWSLSRATISLFLFLECRKRRLYIDEIVTTSTHDFVDLVPITKMNPDLVTLFRVHPHFYFERKISPTYNILMPSQKRI